MSSHHVAAEQQSASPCHTLGTILMPSPSVQPRKQITPPPLSLTLIAASVHSTTERECVERSQDLKHLISALTFEILSAKQQPTSHFSYDL